MESGDKGRSSEDDLGGTFFGGNWGITGEDISGLLSSGGLVLSRAGSGGISSSLGEVTTAGIIWADFSEDIIGTGLGVSGGDKGSNEFYFVLNSF